MTAPAHPGWHNIISEDGEFPPEANRYHLYVGYGCPFAHRALLVRALKGLEDVIGLSSVHYQMTDKGWKFATKDDPEYETFIPDTVNNFEYLSQLYFLSDAAYSGRYTVPVLFDKKTKKIVNNESSEIIRIFNSGFNKLAKNPSLDLYPDALAAEIDRLNPILTDGYVFAVYKAGFATDQQGYEAGLKATKETLLKMEEILKESQGGYLVGNQLTEVDIRVFPSALRHDPVYAILYKCNILTPRDLPYVSAWLKRIFDLPGVAGTVNMDNTRKMYFSNKSMNPTGIVPLYDGPLLA